MSLQFFLPLAGRTRLSGERQNLAASLACSGWHIATQEGHASPISSRKGALPGAQQQTQAPVP